MDEISLPPELETCAADAVAVGRYHDRAEVVAAGVALLRERDAARATFLVSVLAAEEEADRDGCVSGTEMIARTLGRLKATAPARRCLLVRLSNTSRS